MNCPLLTPLPTGSPEPGGTPPRALQTSSSSTRLRANSLAGHAGMSRETAAKHADAADKAAGSVLKAARPSNASLQLIRGRYALVFSAGQIKIIDKVS